MVQLKRFLVLLPVACALILSGCAANSQIMSEEFRGKTIHADLNYMKSSEIAVPYMQQQTTGASGGLIGILAVAAVETAMNVSAANNARELAGSLSGALAGYDFEGKVNQPTIATLKNAQGDWLKIGSVYEMRSLTDMDRKTGIKEPALQGNTDIIVRAEYQYTLSNPYVFNNTLYVKFYKKSEGLAKHPFYWMYVTDQFELPGYKKFFNRNEVKWQDDNGALLREAVTKTTQKINQDLAVRLADPFVKP